MSKVYAIKHVQHLPVSLEQAWDFFSKPANLKEITPTNLGFKVTSTYSGDHMYPGQIIEYTIKPVGGIPLYWMTEITHVKREYFVDEQRYGPYTMWHHQHHFKPVEGGVEMIDLVHYKIPFWFLGDLANWFFVKKQLEAIFQFRYRKPEKLFGKWPG
jgi:ligand-binding SRPBCC domain-containing protein